jgi:hypothetical protein
MGIFVQLYLVIFCEETLKGFTYVYVKSFSAEEHMQITNLCETFDLCAHYQFYDLQMFVCSLKKH